MWRWSGTVWVRVRSSRNLSSYKQARAAAWIMDRGCDAWTSWCISDDRPEMKQLNKNEGGKPMIRFSKASNFVRYSLTVPCCVNLNKDPIGSS